jgi:hypothetical protein
MDVIWRTPARTGEVPTFQLVDHAVDPTYRSRGRLIAVCKVDSAPRGHRDSELDAPCTDCSSVDAPCTARCSGICSCESPESAYRGTWTRSGGRCHVPKCQERASAQHRGAKDDDQESHRTKLLLAAIQRAKRNPHLTDVHSMQSDHTSDAWGDDEC